jgi:pantothenate kinase-related protein Tda10
MRDVTEAWRRLGDGVVGPLAHVVRATGARFVGFGGPPGAGKSTIARAVAAALSEETLVMSLDDFYLSKDERAARGLEWRGPPGSHDLTALVSVLDRLRTGRLPVTVPCFSAEIDDRIEPIVVTREPSHVFLDGWLLGHRGDGYDAIVDRLDLLVFFDAPTDVARARRFGREASLRQRGGGFSEQEMRRFWDEVLGPGIPRWVEGARRSADLVIEDEARRVKTSSEAVAAVLRG